MNKYLPEILTGGFTFVGMQFIKVTQHREYFILGVLLCAFVIYITIKQEQKYENT